MKHLLLTSNIILGGALLLRVSVIGEFDPNVLAPASAGLPEQAAEVFAEQVPGNRINCDKVYYRVAVDSMRSSRQSRRRVLDAVSVAHDYGVYGIDAGIDGAGNAHVDLDPDSDAITKFALYNCDGEFIPSETFLPWAGVLRIARNPGSLQGDIPGDDMGVS